MLSLPIFPEGVQTLQHCDLERLLEILKTSARLRQTIYHHVWNAFIILFTRSNAERLCHGSSIAVRLRNAFEKEKSVLMWLSTRVVHATDHTKQANMRRMIRLRDKNKTRCFVPRDRNFRSICVCILNNSIAHITCTYSSDSNPVPLNVIRATQIAAVFAYRPSHEIDLHNLCRNYWSLVIPSYWWVFRGL